MAFTVAGAKGTPAVEGCSYIALNSKRVFRKDAIETVGNLHLGADDMTGQGGWNILGRFFDSLAPIPHHMQQMEEHVAKLGQKSKPDSIKTERYGEDDESL